MRKAGSTVASASADDAPRASIAAAAIAPGVVIASGAAQDGPHAQASSNASRMVSKG